jgi:hypothetical protein
MKNITVVVTLKDTFSQALTKRELSRTQKQFEEMKKAKGKTIRELSNHIVFNWEIVKIEKIN